MSSEYIDPNWCEGGKVHNWRHYINEPLRYAWLSFTPEQRELIGSNAQEQADKEEWD